MRQPYQSPPPKPATPAMLRLRADATAAIKRKLAGYSSRSRQAWLAEKFGIEQRYAIIADMDETECRTVLDICQQSTLTEK